MKSLSLCILAGLFLSGCASVNSVSLTQIPPQRSKVVSTEKSKTIILGFNFDNDFINTAVEDLKSQCPSGRVTGILTKDETILYFLFFVYKKRVTAEGYCVSGATAGSPRQKRSTSSQDTHGEI